MPFAELEQRLRPLMVASQAGDGAAHGRLLAELAPRLRGYFGRRLGHDAADVEDLVQETLISIHRRRDSYRSDLPLLAWVHAIARFRLVDHLRRAGRRRETPLDDADQFLIACADLDGRLDLARALAALSPRERSLVAAIRLHGRSVAEAAAREGVSPGAAKVAVHRALRRAQELFGGKP